MQREYFKANQVVSICCLTLEFSAKFGYNRPKGSGDWGGLLKDKFVKSQRRVLLIFESRGGLKHYSAMPAKEVLINPRGKIPTKAL